MGRKPNWPPKLVRKPGTGEARAYHAGRWWTCGKWDVEKNEATPAAKAEHARLIARWLADPGSAARPAGEYLLSRLLADFAASADGPKTAHARRMLGRATELLAPWLAAPAAAFGPGELVAWQSGLGGAFARMTVLHLRLQVLRACQFGEDTGRLPEGHAARLWAAVARRPTPGRAPAARRPAVAEHVAETVAALRPTRPVVADLAELHALVGSRVYELLTLRKRDVRTAGVLRTARGATLDLDKEKVWAAEVTDHKNAHLGTERVLVFGPKARAVLRRAMRGKGPDDVLFPLAATVQPDTSYYQFVWYACRRAGVPHWSPRQLRQMVADRVQERFGLEHAAAYLGHGPKGVTARHYLTLALKKAAEAARAVG